MKDARKANLGKEWEALLDVEHTRYHHTGRAVVIRLYPPHRQIRRNADGSALVRYTEPGPCDYIASTAGETYYLDAKDTRENRLPFSMLADHQAKKLDEMERVSASNVGGLLLRLGIESAPRQWFVPWMCLGPRWWTWQRNPARAKPGEAAVGLEWLARNAIPMRGGSDWLTAAIQFSRGGR